MAWDKADNPGSQALYHFNFQGYGPYTYSMYLGLGMGGGYRFMLVVICTFHISYNVAQQSVELVCIVSTMFQQMQS